MNFDINYYKTTASKVFNTDSPSGYFIEINKLIKSLINDLGYECKETNKGNIRVFIKGQSSEKKVATSAHCDTLGLMVRSINSDGTLNVTLVGGPLTPTLDGEYCKVLTRDGKLYTGTVLCKKASVHVYPDARSQERTPESLIVRLDERVESANDAKDLGIQNGDYVFYDPKFTITENGFVKSRFIDDKASAVILLTLLKYFKDNNITPKYDTVMYFVNYEEVGHGASTVDSDIDEFVTIDMGCVGLDLAGNEYAVSIAAKDSGGPYDYELTTRLVNLAKDNNLNYVVDIFPFYGSDIGAAYRSGRDLKGALIGQGVHASHGMERTHLDGIINTMKLMYLYLTK